jgi:hypothetical protein
MDGRKVKIERKAITKETKKEGRIMEEREQHWLGLVVILSSLVP